MPAISRLFPVGLFFASALATSLFCGDMPQLAAQTKVTPPAVPGNFPTLNTPASLGAKPGETVDLVLTGTNLNNANEVWTSFGGKVAIETEQKDAKQLKVNIEVPKDTPIGLHSFRVSTAKGVSNFRPFVIDNLPTVAESGQNNSLTAAQELAMPIVVTGKAEAESSDFFKFPVAAGKPVTIEVLGRRLGSPIDPVILFYDGSGKELGGIYADDTPGLQTDCRLVHTPKQDGHLIVELRDTTYRGGNDYAYRLRIGEFPGATTAFPLAIQRGQPAEVGFAGPDLAGVKPVKVEADQSKGESVLYLSPVSPAGQPGWPVPVAISEVPEVVEQEPNDTPEQAQKLAVPSGVSARFDKKNDQDHYVITAEKGKKLTIEAKTYQFNAPTEVYLRVLDKAGKELAKSNPQQPGAKVEFTPPDNGDFIIACEHLNYLFGPTEVYHLSVTPAEPDFEIALGLDRFHIPQNGTGLLPIVGITRSNGFNQPIEVSLEGFDGLSGSLTIPHGANPQPATPIYLPVKADDKVGPGMRVGHVVAKAKVGDRQLTRTGTLIDGTKSNLAGLPNPPTEMTLQVAAGVVPPTDLALEIQLEKNEIDKGATLKGTVTAKRPEKFEDVINLTLLAIPTNVNVKLNPIAKGAESATFEISPAGNAAATPTAMAVRATAKINGQDVFIDLIAPEFQIKDPPKKK